MRWTSIAAARRQRQPRVPFVIDGTRVGSVAAAHVTALRDWPHWLRLESGTNGAAQPAVHLVCEPSQRDAALAEMNGTLHAAGLIAAWRDEPFALFGADGTTALATLERASARFWGTLTLGAHATGYVAGSDGRPSHLWVSRRAAGKATDPGKLDNLIGGGVPHHQSPHEALVREGLEEAGLTPEQMRPANETSRLLLDRDVPEGHQLERLHAFDLALPAGLVPCNQDGEVASIDLVPVAEAIEIAAGESMTVDASLVTLDFLLRHGLLPADEARALAAPVAALRV